jgi:hypothetical protein
MTQPTRERRYPELLLFEQHETLLERSAISRSVATARGYKSADKKATLRRYGFSGVQLQVPALLLPVYGVITGHEFFQIRPDDPRVTPEGKTIKYETPRGVRMAVDAHPMIRESLGDPSRPLWITEGIRKADAAVSRGLCCLALLGVWNWRGTNPAGGKTALADWEAIALNDRETFICFDSDVMTKPEVYGALDRLARFLETRGASVRFVYLPQDGARKVGLDDYLADDHSVEDLLTLATRDLKRVPARVATDASLDGAAVLDAVRAFFTRYVVFASSHQPVAVTLWCVHTHAVDAAETTPFLSVKSPERRSGKTRVLEVSELLVANPWKVVSPSEAVLYRKIAQDMPTLLLDEVDATFNMRNDAAEPVRAILNAGNRRGTTVTRCVGDDHVLEEFPVFCPRALAGIKNLPDTVADRSIPIQLARKAPHEKVERFRQAIVAEAAVPIRGWLETWTATNLDALRQARPLIPETLNDRAADGWEPLLAIADLAGGDWPAQARAAAVALHCDQTVQEETVAVSLLGAILDVFEEKAVDKISTAELLAALVDRDDGPWAEWWGGDLARENNRGPAAKFARLLKPFGISSQTIRLDGQTAKGYALDAFNDARARYWPQKRGNNVTTQAGQGLAGDFEDITNANVTFSKPAFQPLRDKGCDVVTSSNDVDGGTRVPEGDSLVDYARKRLNGGVIEVRPSHWTR